MIQECSEVLVIENSPVLSGELSLYGAKNAVLVIMASLILTRGISRLRNVPASDDVLNMILLLESLGARIVFDQESHVMEINTTTIDGYEVEPELIKRMRASVLVMGPLLARFGNACVALPGGCAIGKRPIDYHLALFEKMGVAVRYEGEFVHAYTSGLQAHRLVLEYPSVGATENVLMAAVLTPGTTVIVNAAQEPEVIDLVKVLQAMGARITLRACAQIEVIGVQELHAVDYTIMTDRLEAGVLLLASAMTGGTLYLPNAQAYTLDLFLEKLKDMGHSIRVGTAGLGIELRATAMPRAVSFKTAPYPGFPTDLQAPMMAAQCLAQGISVIEETVFENRLAHIKELSLLGASIVAMSDRQVRVTGVEELIGTHVQATDIRAAAALMLAGLVAHGSTTMTGIQFWRRGYDGLAQKLRHLGARVDERIVPAHSGNKLSNFQLQ